MYCIHGTDTVSSLNAGRERRVREISALCSRSKATGGTARHSFVGLFHTKGCDTSSWRRAKMEFGLVFF